MGLLVQTTTALVFFGGRSLISVERLQIILGSFEGVFFCLTHAVARDLKSCLRAQVPILVTNQWGARGRCG